MDVQTCIWILHVNVNHDQQLQHHLSLSLSLSLTHTHTHTHTPLTVEATATPKIQKRFMMCPIEVHHYNIIIQLKFILLLNTMKLLKKTMSHS
jgi:hypothetical protein